MSELQKTGSQKLLRFGLLGFVSLTAILILLYYLLLAKDYAVLFENLRESDTSAVVAELGKQGIGYRLENDGHTVLVDKGEIASARVAVAAANVLAGGDVGFELFNDSDIGLSEFSQKMNYLRALQGELTRTIMAMDGVRFARVHLALPERSIFRNEQARPSAAITVQTIDGQPLAQSRVQGLQQLVAASVTDLAADQVVILDDAGMPLSAPPSAGAAGAGMSERAAFEQYARVKATGAIRDLMGDRPFELSVSARALAPAVVAGAAEAPAAGTPAADAPQRLQIIVRTATALSPEEQAPVADRITGHLALDLGAGDSVTFQTGIVRPAADLSSPALARADATWNATAPDATARAAPARDSAADWLGNRWLWFLAGLIAVILWLVWRQRGSLSEVERQHFADTLAGEIERFRSERNG